MVFPFEVGLEKLDPALMKGAGKRKWAWELAAQTVAGTPAP
jgi:hypothetical protein